MLNLIAWAKDANSQLVTCNGLDCNVCKMLEMVTRIFDYLVYISAAVAILFLVIGGLIYIGSRGKETWMAQAKRAIVWSITGFGIVLLSHLAINAGFKIMGASGSWWSVDCNSDNVAYKTNLPEKTVADLIKSENSGGELSGILAQGTTVDDLNQMVDNLSDKDMMVFQKFIDGDLKPLVVIGKDDKNPKVIYFDRVLANQLLGAKETSSLISVVLAADNTAQLECIRLGGTWNGTRNQCESGTNSNINTNTNTDVLSVPDQFSGTSSIQELLQILQLLTSRYQELITNITQRQENVVINPIDQYWPYLNGSVNKCTRSGGTWNRFYEACAVEKNKCGGSSCVLTNRYNPQDGCKCPDGYCLDQNGACISNGTTTTSNLQQVAEQGCANSGGSWIQNQNRIRIVLSGDKIVGDCNCSSGSSYYDYGQVSAWTCKSSTTPTPTPTSPYGVRCASSGGTWLIAADTGGAGNCQCPQGKTSIVISPIGAGNIGYDGICVDQYPYWDDISSCQNSGGNWIGGYCNPMKQTFSNIFGWFNHKWAFCTQNGYCDCGNSRYATPHSQGGDGVCRPIGANEPQICADSGGKWMTGDCLPAEGQTCTPPNWCECGDSKFAIPISAGGDGICHELSTFSGSCTSSGGIWTSLSGASTKSNFCLGGNGVSTPYNGLGSCQCPNNGCLNGNGKCTTSNSEEQNCKSSGGSWSIPEAGAPGECDCGPGKVAIPVSQGGNGTCKGDIELQSNCSTTGGSWTKHLFLLDAGGQGVSMSCTGQRPELVDYTDGQVAGCLCANGGCLDGNGKCSTGTTPSDQQNCTSSGGVWQNNRCSCAIHDIFFSISSGGDNRCHKASELQANCTKNSGFWNTDYGNLISNNPIASKSCNTNQTLIFHPSICNVSTHGGMESCISLATAAACSCPDGKCVDSTGTCQAGSTPNPASLKCQQSGGTWTTKRNCCWTTQEKCGMGNVQCNCAYPPGYTGLGDPGCDCPPGKCLDSNGYCTDDSSNNINQCIKEGGQWNGSKCINPAKDSCLSSGRVWAPDTYGHYSCQSCSEGMIYGIPRIDNHCHQVSELQNGCQSTGGTWNDLGHVNGVPRTELASNTCVQNGPPAFYQVIQRISCPVGAICDPAPPQSYSCKCPNNYCVGSGGRCIPSVDPGLSPQQRAEQGCRNTGGVWNYNNQTTCPCNQCITGTCQCPSGTTFNSNTVLPSCPTTVEWACEPAGIAKKPAVYLYPKETSKVDVKVDVKGEIVKSIPDYNDGWSVIADKNGTIDKRFDYLFYEAQLNKIELPNEGWVAKGNELKNWFDNNLPKLGLNKKEMAQFEEYWLSELPQSNYYEIKLLSDSFLKENMNLVINPQPNVVIRRNFYFKPLENKINIEEPKIVTPERSGFTVVEWGGILE